METTTTEITSIAESLVVNLTLCGVNNYSNQRECIDLDPRYDRETFERILGMVVPLLFGIIGIVGLIGNSLVVIVVFTNTGMRSPTNILIGNRAVADLLFVLFCIPFAAADFVLPCWLFGDAWCKIVQYLIIVTACASIWTLVLISLDKCLAVAYPVASRSVRTDFNALLAICVAWSIILIASVPILIIHGEIAVVHQYVDPSTMRIFTECTILPEFNWPFFQISFFLVSYVTPLILICGLYFCMLTTLSSTRTSTENRRGKKRATRLVIVLVAVYAVCWCPLQVILVAKSLDSYPLTTTTIMIQIASHVLAYTNSCVNPILYSFLCEKFRNAFYKITRIRLRPEIQPRLGPQTRTTRPVSNGNVL